MTRPALLLLLLLGTSGCQCIGFQPIFNDNQALKMTVDCAFFHPGKRFIRVWATLENRTDQVMVLNYWNFQVEGQGVTKQAQPPTGGMLGKKDPRELYLEPGVPMTLKPLAARHFPFRQARPMPPLTEAFLILNKIPTKEGETSLSVRFALP